VGRLNSVLVVGTSDEAGHTGDKGRQQDSLGGFFDVVEVGLKVFHLKISFLFEVFLYVYFPLLVRCSSAAASGKEEPFNRVGPGQP
jgi:hypothetical protein